MNSVTMSTHSFPILIFGSVSDLSVFRILLFLEFRNKFFLSLYPLTVVIYKYFKSFESAREGYSIVGIAELKYLLTANAQTIKGLI